MAESFDQYVHKAVHALHRKNESCDREFSIGTWERFDFDLSRAQLVFSHGGVPKVVADVQMVGSTGRNSKTWKWGWANAHVPMASTGRMKEVREFGRERGYAPLKTETLRDNEHLGWDMTAVAVEVLGGIGGYRCPTETGFVYFVITSLAWSDGVAPKEDTKLREVTCGAHGKGFETFVCVHLTERPAQEWHSDEPSEVDQWPAAWCGACKEKYDREGEVIDEKAMADDIRLLCHHCYVSLRYRNR